ncbi:hypothetical protein B5G34_08035 [Flavonifractor sp. An82]|uniref:hypothetical protein n=2 Tax=Flavonifractor TaxID=946234 RepID=UPI000B38CD25|nr:hypothetical protein [Flavonifractor sp. An82]OUN22390.1 hypothetical protein B5G34_08035 [Flavonifractor sp. An82]
MSLKNLCLTKLRINKLGCPAGADPRPVTNRFQMVDRLLDEIRSKKGKYSALERRNWLVNAILAMNVPNEFLSWNVQEGQTYDNLPEEIKRFDELDVNNIADIMRMYDISISLKEGMYTQIKYIKQLLLDVKKRAPSELPDDAKVFLDLLMDAFREKLSKRLERTHSQGLKCKTGCEDPLKEIYGEVLDNQRWENYLLYTDAMFFAYLPFYFFMEFLRCECSYTIPRIRKTFYRQRSSSQPEGYDGFHFIHCSTEEPFSVVFHMPALYPIAPSEQYEISLLYQCVQDALLNFMKNLSSYESERTNKDKKDSPAEKNGWVLKNSIAHEFFQAANADTTDCCSFDDVRYTIELDEDHVPLMDFHQINYNKSDQQEKEPTDSWLDFKLYFMLPAWSISSFIRSLELYGSSNDNTEVTAAIIVDIITDFYKDPSTSPKTKKAIEQKLENLPKWMRPIIKTLGLIYNPRLFISEEPFKNGELADGVKLLNFLLYLSPSRHKYPYRHNEKINRIWSKVIIAGCDFVSETDDYVDKVYLCNPSNEIMKQLLFHAGFHISLLSRDEAELLLSVKNYAEDVIASASATSEIYSNYVKFQFTCAHDAVGDLVYWGDIRISSWYLRLEDLARLFISPERLDCVREVQSFLEKNSDHIEHIFDTYMQFKQQDDRKFDTIVVSFEGYHQAHFKYYIPPTATNLLPNKEVLFHAIKQVCGHIDLSSIQPEVMDDLTYAVLLNTVFKGKYNRMIAQLDEIFSKTIITA